MKAVVVGGGIAGLAAAIGLRSAGIEVEVLERRAEPAAEGAGISLFGNGFTALDAIGAGDAVRTICASHPPPGQAGIRRPDGTWLSRTGPAVAERMRIVHRAELLDALRNCLPNGAIRWSFDVRELVEDDTHVVVRSTCGESVDADLVVAADGIGSRIRGSWPHDPGTEYVGYSAWRGISRRPVDIGGAGGETWGNGLRFGYAPLRDGRVYWFAVATMQPAPVSDLQLQKTLTLLEKWHDPIGRILRATSPQAIFWLPIHALRQTAPTFARGRVALLGDAAHAMTPDLGQGANQAFEDAATLATLLARAVDVSDLTDALERYDSLRRPRTATVASRARRIGALAHPRMPWLTPLRDLLMRAVPDSLVDRQALALQSWRPPK
ncbi:FAD-dependent monooxygenase [Rhodococcus sp. ABRD24]|uniref:FAD-dependent monooxygenase n=1 Tax=Rhodococcus sp. ABRD24 TaxID=2507582 RepID=UPI0013F1449D|nr:FAD-dependent monooxygenase [Rhodococcus sp. ABRD24]